MADSGFNIFVCVLLGHKILHLLMNDVMHACNKIGISWSCMNKTEHPISGFVQ